MGETGIVGGDGVVLCFCFGLVDLGAYAQAAVQGKKKYRFCQTKTKQRGFNHHA